MSKVIRLTAAEWADLLAGGARGSLLLDEESRGVEATVAAMVQAPVRATLLATAVVVLVVAFANIFTVIEPVMEAGDWSSALWMVGGPAFFSLLALGIYENYRRRTAVQLMVEES